ncbi:MAG: alpha-N-arabinofuranosidase [Oscillospiraceae bacterium]|nr:alpha-N-arabinofuranosidase [Oscillospiraceae bacterium]
MARIIIDADNTRGTISRHIYGHFSEHLGRCVYEGLYVGPDSPIAHVNGMRSDVTAALREMGLPSLRWPGGCFADEYHWKDGVGENRKRMVNTHWGGVVEDNSFGTHEFMELCRQLDCEPYVNGNVGSGEVAEMQEWVEYMTFGGESPMAAWRERNGRGEPWKLKYFGVGNENWGCGGNMCPSFYAQMYKRYATYVRNYGDNRVFRIACGAGTSYGSGPGLNLDWTEAVMKHAAHLMDGYSLHYYTVPGTWQQKGRALDFTEEEYYKTLKKALWVDEVIRRHAAVMERYDPERRVKIIFDEWGTWYDVEPGTNPGFLYQQNTMRDALVAALTLHIFQKHCGIVHMANIAQLCNVLQAVILTDKEKMLLTPTYHVFKMFKAHQDAEALESVSLDGRAGPDGEWSVPQISHSASRSAGGAVTLTVANLSGDTAAEIDLLLAGGPYTLRGGEILAGPMNAHNTFDAPATVAPAPFNGFAAGRSEPDGTRGTLTLPPCSVVSLRFD